jgi:hypothetical protein
VSPEPKVIWANKASSSSCRICARVLDRVVELVAEPMLPDVVKLQTVHCTIIVEADRVIGVTVDWAELTAFISATIFDFMHQPINNQQMPID